MAISLITRFKRLQEAIREIGLGQTQLALPAPKILALPAPTKKEIEQDALFTALIKESRMVDVCRDLYTGAHYNQAVQEAFLVVDTFIQKQSGKSDLHGTKLMELVFSEHSPLLSWSSRQTLSQKDEHRGYARLYAGAMLGVRNPTVHSHDWVDDAETALELIAFAQHLFRKARAASRLADEQAAA